MIALVEPPMAMSTIMAFGKASGVRMRDGRKSSLTISTIRRPLASAVESRRESGAGMLAQPGSVMPKASARFVMVEAVPVVLQCPGLRENARLDFTPSFLADAAGAKLIPVTAVSRAGAQVLAAPLAAEHRPSGNHCQRRGARAGVVLSHPQSRTTPSTG